MKIAVISDIHGNMPALENVLKDIKSQNCEKILCLGDLALAGPQPDKVINFIKKQEDWEVIQGNTDKLIGDFQLQTLENLKSNFSVMGNALEEEVQMLTKEQKEYLKNLPAQKTLIIDGVKILAVHGSPRRNNEDILPDRPISEIEEIFKDTTADLIFCGHTHIPCGYQTKFKQTIVNAGSVGRPMTKNALPCYAVAKIKDGNFSIEHRLVDYDKNLAAKLLLERRFEGKEKIAEMLLHPTQRHV